MLSCSNLGKYGRLGNQMFQYASLKGIANKRGFDFCIPYSNYIDYLQEFTDHQLLKWFEMPDAFTAQAYPRHTYQESSYGFNFNPALFTDLPDDTDLVGHFQSEKYFKHIREDLLKDFKIKNSESISLPDFEYTAIHVRRTDYTQTVNQSYHGLCSEEYYLNAMKKIGFKIPLLIISDDIEWCRQQPMFEKCNFYRGRNNIEDLYVMSKAKNNIIANSTYSWWGAWLNDNYDKIVVAPQNWFGPAAGLDESDIIPEDWIKI